MGYSATNRTTIDAIEGFRGFVSAKAVANYVLDWSESHGIFRTNLDIQKLVYFCHVFHIVKTGGALVRESFEAWPYGPVVPSLYNALKGYERERVTTHLTSLSATSGAQEPVPQNWSKDTEKILRDAMSVYGSLSTHNLIKLSHEKGGPWDCRFHPNQKDTLGPRIFNSEIRSFYTSGTPPSH